MTVTAIQIGLDPDVIDCSSADFAQFPGLSKEKLRAANAENVAGLRAAGYDVDNCLIDVGQAGADKAGKWLAAKRYDAVLIGARVRLVGAHPAGGSWSPARPSPPPTTSGAGTRTPGRWPDDHVRR